MKKAENLLAKPFQNHINFFLYLILPYSFITIFWFYLGAVLLKLSQFEIFFYTMNTYGALIGLLLGLAQPKKREAGFGLLAGLFGFNINIPVAAYLIGSMFAALLIFLPIKGALILFSALGLSIPAALQASFDPILAGEIFVRSISSNSALVIYLLLPVIGFSFYSLLVFNQLNDRVLNLAEAMIASPILLIALPITATQQVGYMLLTAVAVSISPLGIIFAVTESFKNAGVQPIPAEEKF